MIYLKGTEVEFGCKKFKARIFEVRSWLWDWRTSCGAYLRKSSKMLIENDHSWNYKWRKCLNFALCAISSSENNLVKVPCTIGSSLLWWMWKSWERMLWPMEHFLNNLEGIEIGFIFGNNFKQIFFTRAHWISKQTTSGVQ